MGLLNNMKKLVKKEATATPQQSISEEKQVQAIHVTNGIDPKVIDAMNERMTKIENNLGKMTAELEGQKKSLSDMKNELEGIKENVKMVVSLYELVSRDFNPFMDKTPEEIRGITEELSDQINNLKRLVESAIKDLRELYGVPDIDQVIQMEEKK
ncbi:flagella accessory protein C [Thermoplasma volcanium]|nr:flagella accessory protein C [Thermoplasma volcanium]